MFSIVKVARDQTRPGSLLARPRGRLDERPWERGCVFDKQILKVWTPCLLAFYCVILRATLAWSLNACAIVRFSR